MHIDELHRVFTGLAKLREVYKRVEELKAIPNLASEDTIGMLQELLHIEKQIVHMVLTWKDV